MSMRSRYVTVLERELHYVEWGAGNGENVIMWHGLALAGRIDKLVLNGNGPQLAQAMRERGPRARVVEIAGCGHAPALNVPGQIGLVEAFLAG